MSSKRFDELSSNNRNFLKTLYVIIALFVLLYFYRLGSIGLIDVDEPRYAEAGREILESNNWIVPYFNYVVRYDKPIFFYWLEAFSMKMFGVNEFGSRLPSVLSSFLCLFFLFYFLKTFYSLSSALLGVAVLMSSFEFIALSRFSITDMTLCSFISSSLFSFFLGYNQIISSHRFSKFQLSTFSFWYILGFIFLALSVLTKGPVAMVIVGLVLFSFFWWTGKLEYFFKNQSFYWGLIIFFILVLPWYFAVHCATGGEFTKVFFGIHNLTRYTSIVSGHKGSFFYFFPVVFLGFLPWSFFLIQSIKTVVKKGLHSLLVSPTEQVPWFCLWWFLIILLFFSFSKTKLLTYILPIFPAMSVLVALYLSRIIEKKNTSSGLIFGLGLFFLFCLIVFCIFLFELDVLLPREIKGLKLDIQIIFFSFLMLVGSSMAWASSLKNERMTISILLVTFLLLYFSLVQVFLTKIDIHSQYFLRRYAKSVPSNYEIATYQITKPSLTFYGKRQIKQINSIDKLQQKLDGQKEFTFVTKKKFLNGIRLKNSYKWGEDWRYVTYGNRELEIRNWKSGHWKEED